MGQKQDTERYLYYKGFRIRKDTKQIVSLLYYDKDSKKTLKLKHDPNPQIENTEDKTYYLPLFKLRTVNPKLIEKDPQFKKALEFKRTFKRETHAQMDRTQKRLEWINQWGDKEKEIEKFRKWGKERGLKNLSNEVSFLKRIIFNYFLVEKVCANPLNWYLHHYDFKLWLKKLKKEKGNTPYSVNSLNNFIRTLNCYYSFLEERENQIIPKKCTVFEKHTTNEKGEESYMSVQDRDKIYKALGELEVNYGGKVQPHPKARLLQILFNTLYNTGMRKNEALGISLKDVALGSLRDDYGFINDVIRSKDVPMYGHIYLMSQPESKSIRLADGSVPRRPLKLKKKVSGNNSRYIPILDIDNAKEIGTLIKEQKKLFDKKIYGDDRSNYLLFDGISYQALNIALTKIYAQKGFEGMHHYTVHDLRHSFSSKFTAEVAGGQVSVVSKVLGHSREQITLRYLHLHDKINTHKHIDKSVDDIEDLDLDNLKAL